MFSLFNDIVYLPQGCPVDHVFDDQTKMCVQLIQVGTLSFQDAKDVCEVYGEHLVVIDSPEKSSFIQNALANKTGCK